MNEHGQQLITTTCGEPYFYSRPVPVRGDTHYCRKHSRWEKVATAPGAYRTKCQGEPRKGCSIGRQHGGSLGAARQHASRHLRRCPTHRVEVYDGRVKVETISAPLQPMISTGTLDDPPPF